MLKKIFGKADTAPAIKTTAEVSDEEDMLVECESEGYSDYNHHFRLSMTKMSDFFVRMIALNALDHYEPGYQDDDLIRTIVDGDYILTEKGILSETRFIEKWNQELARKREQKAYSYIIPRDIYKNSDVSEFVAQIRAAYNLPRVFPEHGNTAILSELLDLDATERLVLNFSIWHSDYLRNATSYEQRSLMNSFLGIDRYKRIDNVLKEVLSLKDKDIMAVNQGILRKAAILTPTEGSGIYSINGQLVNTFLVPGLTVEYLEQTLFPSSVKTELSPDDYPHVVKEIRRSMDIIDRNMAAGRPGTNVMLWGAPGTGKTELVLAMAKSRGWNLRVIGDISADDDQEKSREARLASLKLAQKILSNDPKAVLLFDEMEDLFKADNNAAFSKAFINRIIETSPIPIIWTTNSLYHLERSVLRRMIYNINLECPPQETREIIWRRYCKDIGLRLADETITALSKKYEIAPALIRNAVMVAYAVVGDVEPTEETEKEVFEIVENMSKLVNLGEVKTVEDDNANDNPYDMSCVNSDTNLEQLTTDILDANPRWSLCLYGAPGTGKSQFARELGKRMGKKVVLKRASDLQSMWVGECEKNIAKEFAKAREGKYILLIDEGDSFLRNREKARASWEVSQVNEMLSQMERHTEPFVLTTNLMDDIDAAALRRFTFKLEFRYMEPEQAKNLFRQYFDCEPPKEIERNHSLAPGDFANVKAQAVIRRITDPDKLYALLKAETDLKPNTRNGIGF